MIAVTRAASSRMREQAERRPLAWCGLAGEGRGEGLLFLPGRQRDAANPSGCCSQRRSRPEQLAVDQGQGAESDERGAETPLRRGVDVAVEADCTDSSPGEPVKPQRP